MLGKRSQSAVRWKLNTVAVSCTRATTETTELESDYLSATCYFAGGLRLFSAVCLLNGKLSKQVRLAYEGAGKACEECICWADLGWFSFRTAATHRLLRLQLAGHPEENRFYPSRGHRDAAGASKRSSFCWFNLVDLAARLSPGRRRARELRTLALDLRRICR